MTKIIAVALTILAVPALASPVKKSTTTAVVKTSTAPACESVAWTPMANNAFGVGERLEYNVKWGAVKAGSGHLSVGGAETVNGRPVYTAAMELRTTGVTKSIHRFEDRSDSWIDQASLLPIKFTKKTREPKYQQDESVTFDQGCRTYKRHARRLDKGTEKNQEGPLPGDTLDILSYLYHLRALPLAEGSSYDLTLLSGDHLWPVTVHVKKRLKISTPSGWFDCFHLQPTLRPGAPTDRKLKAMEVWVTADARHLPVRLRMEANVGSITAELTSAQNTK
jgi:hypothetical protein